MTNRSGPQSLALSPKKHYANCLLISKDGKVTLFFNKLKNNVKKQGAEINNHGYR